MKYCTNCGAQLPDEAKFCESCGTRQQAEPQSSAPQEEVKKKKSLGEKMMENFRTNMKLQKERRNNILWWYWVIIAVALAYFMGA